MTLKDVQPLLSEVAGLASRAGFTEEAFAIELPAGKGMVSGHIVPGSGRVQLDFEGLPIRTGKSYPLDQFLLSADALQALILQTLDGVQRIPEGMSYPEDFIDESEAS